MTRTLRGEISADTISDNHELFGRTIKHDTSDLCQKDIVFNPDAAESRQVYPGLDGDDASFIQRFRAEL